MRQAKTHEISTGQAKITVSMPLVYGLT